MTQDVVHGIRIDRSRDELLGEEGRILLRKYYMQPDETSPQEAFARACRAYCADDLDLAQRLYEHVSHLHFMFASPVLSNAVLPGAEGKRRALPISCYLAMVDDSIEGLIAHTAELRWLSVFGGGVGGHWSAVRSVSDIAPGPIPFLHTIDSDMQAYKQGTTRKGAYAAYLDVSHPDIEEFIKIRVPASGGDVNRKALNLNNAVTISNAFMEAVLEDRGWDLIDPKTQRVTKTLRARQLWEEILTTRYRSGEPYIMFIDHVNDAAPESYKRLGHRVHGSNLCLRATEEIEVMWPDATTEVVRIGFLANQFTDHPYLINRVMVRSMDTESGDVVWAFVKRAFRVGITDEIVRVTLQNGTEIHTTADHRFWTASGLWVEAKNLTPQDRVVVLVSDDDTDSQFVKSVEILDTAEEVYDLEVPSTSAFFANGILVHNCSEITLTTNPERTAVCCLSSLNLAKWDEWKDTDLVRDLIRMLDNVIDVFIQNAPDSIHRAVVGARQERSLGLGAFGWHDLLQSRMLAIGDPETSELNRHVFSKIKEEALKESRLLAKERGPYPDLIEAFSDGELKDEDVVRNAHLLAIAPNSNNATLAGTSPSVELWRSNAFVNDTRIGSHLVRNKHLQRHLQEIGHDTEEVWQSILSNRGSVQHLEFLSDQAKRVFRTAMEVDQADIIHLAAERQPWICQAQSINLYFPANTQRSYINTVHLLAWMLGLKTLYYLRTEASHNIENVNSKIELQELANSQDGSECVACEA